MTQSPPQTTRLADRCRDALQRLSAAVRPRDRAWLDLDLTMGQLKAMFVLTAHGARSVGGLARALGIGEPATSLLVDKLEERGLARREDDPDDRRRTLVVPTETGRSQITRLRLAREELLTRWLVRMDDDDLRSLLRGIEALVEAVDAAEEERGTEEEGPTP